MIAMLIAIAMLLPIMTCPLPVQAYEGSLGIGFYWDEECTQAVTDIYWGANLSQYTWYDKTFYIRNEADGSGGAMMEFCSFIASNFSPTYLIDDIMLYWDFGGAEPASMDWHGTQTIALDQVKEITLWLRFTGTNATEFSFEYNMYPWLVADANSDTIVDIFDAGIVSSNFWNEYDETEPQIAGGYYASDFEVYLCYHTSGGDLNGDLVVNALDTGLVNANWGSDY